MISKEALAQFLFGSPSLSYIPLLNAGYRAKLPLETSQQTYTFNYQKTTEVKRYIPSESDLDDLLQDNAVKDKEVWIEDIAYLEMLKRSRKQDEVKKYSLRYYLSKVISIISVPIILILPALTIKFHIQNKTNEALYNQFYGTLPTNPAIVGQANITEASFDQALQSYINRNYSFAQKLFKSISANSYYYHLSQFYCGVCNMEENRIDVALAHFRKIGQDVNLNPYLAWYKCLCYVKLGTLKEAIPLLTELQKSNNQFSSKASELLAKIKK